MKSKKRLIRLFPKFTLVCFLLCLTTVAGAQSNQNELEPYFSWSGKQLTKIGKRMRQKGKIGSSFALRGLNTDRAINYKVRATLMTPEMIRASARYHQIKNRLTFAQTRTLVKEAEEACDLAVMIEIDPNEGSGVVPRDGRAFLQPKGLRLGDEGVLAARKSQKLRLHKALTGVFKRKYDYDLFMVQFDLTDKTGKALLDPDNASVELIVGIDKAEERLEWIMPESLKKRIEVLSARRSGNKERE